MKTTHFPLFLMVPAIFISLLLLKPMECLRAQSTLQFSQVILVGAVDQTVPQGKVWKVESAFSNPAMISKPTSGQLSNVVTAIKLNGVVAQLSSQVMGYYYNNCYNCNSSETSSWTMDSMG